MAAAPLFILLTTPMMRSSPLALCMKQSDGAPERIDGGTGPLVHHGAPVPAGVTMGVPRS